MKMSWLIGDLRATGKDDKESGERNTVGYVIGT